MSDLIAEFRKCLSIMSHSRAGWDYDLPPRQRTKENIEEEKALIRARIIWSNNPALQAELRAAFVSENPLATMREIEQSTGGAQ